MPGMAASPAIFERIHLDEDKFECFYLQWKIPEKGETLSQYAKRILEGVVHKEPVLIGVSFGGILVQEMAKLIKVRKLIIISSVKSNKELPGRMRFAKYTGIHKLLPTRLVNNVELLTKYAFGEAVTKRLDLYNMYLSVRDKRYMDWAVDSIVKWEQEEPIEHTIHINGDKDTVFPISNIKSCIVVKGGTHIMIINRFRWFNENLPGIITTG